MGVGPSERKKASLNHADSPWVDQCIGAHNTHLFVLFLVTTSALCLYCTYLSGILLYDYYHTGLLSPPWSRGGDPFK